MLRARAGYSTVFPVVNYANLYKDCGIVMARKLRCLAYLTVFAIVCLFVWIASFEKEETIAIKIRDPSCKIPILSSQDPDFVRLVTPLKYECTATQPNLTVLTDEQNLLLQIEKKLTKCRYRCIIEGPDLAKVKYDTWRDIFSNSTRVDCEFIHVQCWEKDRLVYKNFYSQIVVNKKRVKELNKRKSKSTHHNIILLVIDSVSRVNFERSCPNSIKTLKSLFNWTLFEGFNKNGINSFPNGLALLAGKRLESYSSRVWEKSMDDWADKKSIIWNQAHKNGYLSLFAEDLTWANMFVYDAKGFRNKPTDHRQRAFWRACENETSYCGGGLACLGERRKYSVVLDYVRQFLWKYDRQIPKMVVCWFTRVVHGGQMGHLSNIDDGLVSFLHQNYDHLKESYLFILGDHGCRGADLPDKNFARLQDMMPLFSFSIPQSVARSHPTILTNMQQNSKILSGFYDAYVTIRDILDSEEHGWKGLNHQKDWSFAGVHADGAESLLRPLTISRTCDQIGIPRELCSCVNDVVPLSKWSNLWSRLSHRLISHINLLLSEHAQCAKLELLDTLSIQMLDYSLWFASSYYRVHVRAAPSNGTFEAVMVKKGRDFVVDGLVLRTSRYGNQSHCLRKAVLREYCFCTDLISK